VVSKNPGKEGTPMPTPDACTASSSIRRLARRVAVSAGGAVLAVSLLLQPVLRSVGCHSTWATEVATATGWAVVSDWTSRWCAHSSRGAIVASRALQTA